MRPVGPGDIISSRPEKSRLRATSRCLFRMAGAQSFQDQILEGTDDDWWDAKDGKVGSRAEIIPTVEENECR